MDGKKRKCRVIGCVNQHPNLRFFRFPLDKAEAAKWRDNLRIGAEEKLPPTYSLVCSQHFEPEAVGGKYLKKGALPTLNLGYDEDPPHSCMMPKRMRSCCVSCCVSTSKQILFEFPRQEEARNSWALACNVDASLPDRLFVCQRHFEPQNVTKTKLLNRAVPCLNLEPDTRSRSPSVGSDWHCPPVTKTYDRIPVDDEGVLALEEFEKYSLLEEKRQASLGNAASVGSDITASRERFAQAARYYQSNALKLNERIKELERENADLINRKSQEK
ncbi:uncharacterized protein LOC118739746 [Rhagoletis pomonella]|uniref:uncharacterized protein LOC118739746 n=1 Tax=Rhagoletis pomonella TaxID=28610 RepID=UPI001786E98D|nr:uncharacterized protein LOC118739746 [Rhagoletis pomonella]